jgi:hypothetical protein
MDTMKSTAFFVLTSFVVAFNLKLYIEKEGVLYASARATDGWHIRCRYYTPLRLYEIEAPIQTGCPDFEHAGR